MSETTAQEEVPWKWPVGAAIVGSLVVATYVLFAVVSGPTVDSPGTSTAGGFVPVTDQVGMRATTVQFGTPTSNIFVSTAVLDGSDPASVHPPEIADWIMTVDGLDHAMVRQYSSDTAQGGVTIEFVLTADDPDPSLSAIPVAETATQRDQLTLSEVSLPIVIADQRVELDGGVLVIDELWIDDGFGSVRWHVEGGTTAELTITVGVVGQISPFLLPIHETAPIAGTPSWSRGGEIRLLADGDATLGPHSPIDLVVDVVVESVTVTGDPISIPLVAPTGP